MPIKVQCPACANKLSVPDSYAGKRGKCPKCSTQINIPANPTKKKPTEAASDEFPSFSDKGPDAGLSAPNISVPATAAPDLSAPVISGLGSTSASENPFAVTPRKKGNSVKKSPMTKAPSQPLNLTSSRLRQIGVLSTGTTIAIIYAILGLILGLLFAGLTMIGTVLGASSGPDAGGILAFGIGSAIASILVLPLLYGIGGFFGGSLMALLYNLAASMSGGIEFKFEE